MTLTQTQVDHGDLPAVRPRLQPRWRARLATLSGAGALALALTGGISAASGALPGAWTSLGPDYAPTARGGAEANVCSTLGAGHDQARCVAYLAGDAGTDAARTPRADGGRCVLASRFDCTQALGLEQDDTDVPLWRPWDLHNGAAGTGFAACVGALGGLAVLVAGRALVGMRAGLGRVTLAVIGGELAGAVLFDLGRHTLVPAGTVGIVPVWAAPVTALGSVAALWLWRQRTP